MLQSKNGNIYGLLFAANYNYTNMEYIGSVIANDRFACLPFQINAKRPGDGTKKPKSILKSKSLMLTSILT